MPSVTLKFNSASREGVNFSYDGTGWNYPSDTSASTSDTGWSGSDTRETRTITATRTMYSKGETTWSWVFTRNSNTATAATSKTKNGSMTINGFTAGSRQSVTGKLSAKRTSQIEKKVTKQTRTRTKTPIKDADGNPTGQYSYGSWVNGTPTTSTTYSSGPTYSMGPASTTLAFYTRPLEFSWTVVPGLNVLISSSLTATKWNELMDKAAQRYNWKNCQQGQSGTAKAIGQNHVKSGDIILASTYNTGASLCEVTNRATAGSTVISASLFNALSNAVNAG